jgi:hypothetical protein
MERGSFQTYVASLEQIMKNTHFDLREAMDQFQELCHRLAPERIVPTGIITHKGQGDQSTPGRQIQAVLSPGLSA